jgi:transcriptional regulator with XRE-family HTH domain
MTTVLQVKRLKRGIRQWRLASLIGISQSLLSHYESGRRQCPPDVRQKIAEVLELPVEKLFPDGEAL